MKRRMFTFEGGETFEEPADWTEFVRRALFGLAVYPAFGVNTHYDYDGADRRFYDLYKALAGTGAEHDFADGVLRVIETGTSAERYEARLGPYDLAPDARRRIEHLLTNCRGALIEAKLFNVLLSRLFQMPGSPESARTILRRELADPSSEELAYTATKHAISGLTKSTSLDGRRYDIACGQIDIGNAATDMAARMATGVPQANGEIAVEPLLDLDHVARAVVYMAGLPLDANVLSMTVMATKMPFVGRG